MGIQVRNRTTASAPWKAKIFVHSLPERSREITRAIFVNSAHNNLLTTTMIGGSAETPGEGLMIWQLCCCCSTPLRRGSDELSVIVVVAPERRRIEDEALWESHGCPRRPRNANVAAHPCALGYASDIVISGSDQIGNRRKSSDAFVKSSQRPPPALCIHFSIWLLWIYRFHDIAPSQIKMRCLQRNCEFTGSMK